MAIQVLMPALSPTMTEGTIAKWLKAEGDAVASGDVLCEIETDKATMEVEAVDEGSLGKILIPEGTQGVAVNTPIAVILEEGEDASAASGVCDVINWSICIRCCGYSGNVGGFHCGVSDLCPDCECCCSKRC